MPLIKKSSKQAFQHNVKAEMDAGNPQPKSLAVSYNTQKMARKKKMAYGGAAENDMEPGVPTKKPDNYREPEGEYMGEQWSYGSPPPRKPDDERRNESEYMADHFAKGGEVDDHYASIADAILKKKRMADGGMVDMNESAQETPASLSPYDDENADATLRELYDDDQLESQPSYSNEKGDSREDDESDKFDLVSQIRKKYKSK